MIAGLEEPTSGDILIGGQVVNDLPPRERGIAMVFQSYALYPHLTVVQQHRLPAEGAGRRRRRSATQARVGRRARSASSICSHRKPRELSGGERQRVALARAIVREPSSFSSTSRSRTSTRSCAPARAKSSSSFRSGIGTTTIYVTHDQVEAMAMGDRVAVMSQGSVRQIGTPAEVYDEPADTFVATLPRVAADEHPRRPDDVLVGFRPEHFLPPGSRRPARARTSPYRFRIGAQRVPRRRADPLRHDRGRAPSMGQKVDLAHPVDARRRARTTARAHTVRRRGRRDLKFFDRESGEARPPRGVLPRVTRPAALARAGDVHAGDPLHRRAGRRAVRPRVLLQRRRREGREPGLPLRRTAKLRNASCTTRPSAWRCATPSSSPSRSQVLVLIGANILALALQDAFRGRRFLRFLILLPWVAPVSIGSIGWKWLLDSLYSVINWVLVRAHLVKPFDTPDVARRAEAGDDLRDRGAHVAHAAVRDGDHPGRAGRRSRRTSPRRPRSTAPDSSGRCSRSRFR